MKTLSHHFIALYQQYLNLQTANFSRIEHEDAMVAIVYKVIQPNEKQFILKICERPNDYLREVYFLEKIVGNIPVPKIIQVVQPKEDVPGAILMEYLSGTLLKPTELTESLAFEIGYNLALIHSNRLTGYGDPIQDDLDSNPRNYFNFKFEEGLDECRDHLPVSLVEKCRSYYEAHVDLLMLVDGPCIVHRDFRPGNLIIDHGKLKGVIDWAGARASFAEEDFCSIEHEEWLQNIFYKQTFLAGYASIRPIPNYNLLLPFLRLSKAVAMIGFLVKCGTWENTHSDIYQFNRHFLETL